MRVIYEISLEDMRGILAEKYEIDAAKIEFMGHGDLVFARIDVSETETPEKTVKVEYPKIDMAETIKKVKRGSSRGQIQGNHRRASGGLHQTRLYNPGNCQNSRIRRRQ